MPPVTAMPMSWLKPALDVQRSEFALKTASESTAGVKVTVRFVASMFTQVEPLLPARLYCVKVQLATQWGEVVLEQGGTLKLKARMLAPCGTKIQPPSSARVPKWLEPPPSAALTRCMPVAGSKPYNVVPPWFRVQIRPIAAMGGPGDTF